LLYILKRTLLLAHRFKGEPPFLHALQIGRTDREQVKKLLIKESREKQQQKKDEAKPCGVLIIKARIN